MSGGHPLKGTCQEKKIIHQQEIVQIKKRLGSGFGNSVFSFFWSNPRT